jgi:tetratricopeptide (TPR) repeat protein
MAFSLERGKRLYESKKYRLAIKELKGMDVNMEENPEVAYYIGLSFTQLEEWDTALFFLEQVVNSNYSFFHSFQCRMVLGYIYSTTKRYKLAEFEYRHLLKEGIESVQVYASLAHVAYIQRNVDESLEYLEKALEIQPDYASALNSLGYIYAEEEIDADKAITLCRKAVNQQPRNGAYLDSLGWAYFKAGKTETAKSFLRQALEALPGNKDIARHMKAVLGT